jgi:hypothetical protein
MPDNNLFQKLGLNPEVSKPMNSVLEQIRSQFTKISQVLSKSLKDFENNMPNLIAASRELARLGWTIPPSFAPGEIYDLLEKSKEPNNLDLFMIDFYASDSNKEFQCLSKQILTTEAYSQWYELLNQCIKAYKKDLYLPTIPSLFPVLEGSISLFLSDKSHRKLIEICKFHFENSTELSISKVIWASTLKFLNKVFESYSFDQEPPQFINRHAILHGRSASEWTKADSLRLFNALYTISCVLHDIK